MPKIKTIPKYEMKKVKQRSPSLIDEMVLAIEQLLSKKKGKIKVTNDIEWIKISERLPNVGEYVWVAGEMKYTHEKECTKFVDLGWLNQNDRKKTEDYYRWDTTNDWYEGQQYFKITHWAEIKYPSYPCE